VGVVVGRCWWGLLEYALLEYALLEDVLLEHVRDASRAGGR
jgi:hypothetical protein